MNLIVETKQRVLHVRLNRPEKRNALTAEMCEGIVLAVEAAQEGSHIGCILLTGVGHVFCAGMDLDEAQSAKGVELGPIHEKLFTLGAQSLKPIVV